MSIILLTCSRFIYRCLHFNLYCFFNKYLFDMVRYSYMSQLFYCAIVVFCIFVFEFCLCVVSIECLCFFVFLCWQNWFFFIEFKVKTSIKSGVIQHFLEKKLPEPSQEYDSFFLFVWWIWAFDFQFDKVLSVLGLPWNSVIFNPEIWQLFFIRLYFTFCNLITYFLF